MPDVIKEHIRKYGWHCLHVFPTDEGQDRFTYSIGFSESYSAPEVMVFGLPREKAHPLISECAQLLKSGASITCNVEDARILAGGYKVVFKPVAEPAYDEYLGTACRHYGNRTFGAVVMFLPDKWHCFPWDPEYQGARADESLSIV